MKVKAWKKNLAMWATWFRVALVPILVALYFIPWKWMGIVQAVLFTLASITDYYDGHWARKYGSVSDMGKLMDPIADKLLVSSALIMMIPLGQVHPLAVVLLLGRDTWIGGIRSMAASQNLIIAAGQMGKWKTGLQMVAIPALMIDRLFFDLRLDLLGTYLLWFTVLLSVKSAFDYTWAYFRSRRDLEPAIFKKRKERKRIRPARRPGL